MDDAVDNDSIAKSQEWKRPEEGAELDPGIDNRLIVGDQKGSDGELEVHSLSGKERNHFFLNGESGKTFTDLSGLSGLDSESDSRSFGLLDYDRDGFLDIALVNANQPLTQLFHNQFGQLNENGGKVIAIRFVGGNQTAGESTMSNRDGYGAFVELKLSNGKTIKREHHCGEGYAAQNSRTMLVGIGDRDNVESLTVRWPSGKKTSLENIPAGTLVIAHESREEGAFEQKPYLVSPDKTKPRPIVRPRFPIKSDSEKKGIRVYTTMATWCAACAGHLPALEALKKHDIALYGVPLDPDDDTGKLDTYLAEKQPPYEMIKDLSVADKEQIDGLISSLLKRTGAPLPSTVLTNERGEILEVLPGIPTLSQVRKWETAE